MTKKSNREFRKIKSLLFLYEINENGTILRNVKSKKHLKIKLDHHHSEKGYYMSFVNIKGKIIRVPIHRAVAECWLGDRPDGYVIDHIDRNTRNNHYTNLRYCTVSENMKNRELSARIIEQAKKNCLKYVMEYIAKPVTIVRDGKSKQFPSMSQAAEYIAKEYGVKKEQIRSRFKKRRKRIYDYDIIYRTEETIHEHPKG